MVRPHRHLNGCSPANWGEHLGFAVDVRQIETLSRFDRIAAASAASRASLALPNVIDE
jgi:hypothetical protein